MSAAEQMPLGLSLPQDKPSRPVPSPRCEPAWAARARPHRARRCSRPRCPAPVCSVLRRNPGWQPGATRQGPPLRQRGDRALPLPVPLPRVRGRWQRPARCPQVSCRRGAARGGTGPGAAELCVTGGTPCTRVTAENRMMSTSVSASPEGF